MSVEQNDELNNLARMVAGGDSPLTVLVLCAPPHRQVASGLLQRLGLLVAQRWSTRVVAVVCVPNRYSIGEEVTRQLSRYHRRELPIVDFDALSNVLAEQQGLDLATLSAASVAPPVVGAPNLDLSSGSQGRSSDSSSCDSRRSDRDGRAQAEVDAWRVHAPQPQAAAVGEEVEPLPEPTPAQPMQPTPSVPVGGSPRPIRFSGEGVMTGRRGPPPINAHVWSLESLQSWTDPRFESSQITQAISFDESVMLPALWHGTLHGQMLSFKPVRERPDVALEVFEIWNTLRHERIVSLLGRSVIGHCAVYVVEHLYVSVEYYIYHVVPPGSPLDVHLLTRMAMDVAAALAYMHSLRVMHRNVRPQSLYLDNQMFCKLGDLDVAKVSYGVEENTPETGSYRYMAPEVVQHNSYSVNCDIYSYAMTLFEITHRQRPFHSLNAEDAALQAVYHGQRPQLQLPAEWSFLEEIIRSCWSSEASSRPSALEIKSRFELRVSSTAQQQ